MANPFTLSTVTALALAGAGLGLYLGKSAIAEINPAYFGGSYSETRFHTDLVANRPNFDAQQARLQDASLVSGYGTGCVGCLTYPEEYFPDPEPAIEYAAYTASSVPQQMIEETEREIEQMTRRAELVDVERYAHYQISADDRPSRFAAVKTEAEPTSPTEAGQGGPDCAVDEECQEEAQPST